MMDRDEAETFKAGKYTGKETPEAPKKSFSDYYYHVLAKHRRLPPPYTHLLSIFFF